MFSKYADFKVSHLISSSVVVGIDCFFSLFVTIIRAAVTGLYLQDAVEIYVSGCVLIHQG